MLSTISSQQRSVDSSQSLKSKEFEFDCVSSLTTFDTVDNPLLKQILGNDRTKREIFQQMKSEHNRLYSFQNKWPLHNITPESLAEAGFFYLQLEDKVQCPFCEIIISKWTQGDKPLREHMKNSPKCPFLMGQDVGNISISEKQNIFDQRLSNECSSNSMSVSYKPKHPRMADVKRRLLTYSGWPLNEPGPQQLAECGLYYSGVADVVTCFFCGGTLGNWEPDDDPWFEHAKFFPECSFLELAKNKRNHSLKVKSCGKSFIDQKPLVPRLPSVETNSEVVQQALNIFPKDLVVEAVKKRFGSNFSLQEICDDILALKQKSDVKNITSPHLEIKTNTHAASNVDLLMCKVCMDKERGVVFQPCGHFVTCWNCANMIADCPVCRTPIMHKIRTYIS